MRILPMSLEEVFLRRGILESQQAMILSGREPKSKTVSLPSMEEMVRCGVHYGHRKYRWNPKMSAFLHPSSGDLHIFDLTKTMILMRRALEFTRSVASDGRRILIVGTKRQCTDIVQEAAIQCAQYYVNARWPGGMMTNWDTVTLSVEKISEIESLLESEEAKYLGKKELLSLRRKHSKLNRVFGGVRTMGSLPDLLFVIDTNRESIAIKEAQSLDIPVVAIVDSNSDPRDIDYPIPGNDDSTNAIRLYCSFFSKAVLSGLEERREEQSLPKQSS